jgi:DNA (cytosine-5)-methyltransferase 1
MGREHSGAPDDLRYFEFFCGAGMVRAALGSHWKCDFANDFDNEKCAIYRRNFSGSWLRSADIASLTTSDLPIESAHLAWASFPCQDLSVAGNGAGLQGRRSGTFWHFWALMETLARQGRAPKVIALENVCGTLSSHSGGDFRAIADAFRRIGYRVGAFVIDAESFLPQSRPRLFFIGISSEDAPHSAERPERNQFGASTALLRAHDSLSPEQKRNWLWWKLPQPPNRTLQLGDLVDADGTPTVWHSRSETQRLISLMNDLHREKLSKISLSEGGAVGTIYRRTRRASNGVAQQRAEVRFDGVAGCLRTPGGGSSRQILIFVRGKEIRTRLLSAREAARLMGLPEQFVLPESYSQAYRLAGDGVAVPVVAYLASKLIEPLLHRSKSSQR